ncbi:MAG: ABC transporter ATP-binding protein [Elusimicrobiales bacterium]
MEDVLLQQITVIMKNLHLRKERMDITVVGTDNILELVNVSVKYGDFYALRNVSINIRRGERIGILGQSGSGKTTLCRVIAQIEKNEGQVLWRSPKRNIQFVFQDPASSLNPRMRVFDIVTEPLVIKGFKKNDLGDIFERVMMDVGLNPTLGSKYPHQISGGQRQRVSIARALTLQPDLLICDEPVSGLDVSVAGQVLNLLDDLQKKYGFAMIFVSHDISFVYYLTEKTVVFLKGEITEIGPTSSIIEKPAHPYTKLLISSILSIGTKKRGFFDKKSCEIKSPCPFSYRCPYIWRICSYYNGRLFLVQDAHYVSCVRYKDL